MMVLGVLDKDIYAFVYNDFLCQTQELSLIHISITDIDGRFTLVVSEKTSLVFSYIGYLTQEMVVGKKPFLNVQLQEDNKTLDEVVITGYGLSLIHIYGIWLLPAETRLSQYNVPD